MKFNGGSDWPKGLYVVKFFKSRVLPDRALGEKPLFFRGATAANINSTANNGLALQETYLLTRGIINLPKNVVGSCSAELLIAPVSMGVCSLPELS